MSDEASAPQPATKPSWGRWFGRPGRSLTRRLIWLASAWIVVALMLTGWMLTSQYQESALRRLGNSLGGVIDDVVIASVMTPEGLRVAEIKDAPTLRGLSGKYWMVGRVDADGGFVVLAKSPSLSGESLYVDPELPGRLQASMGSTLSYNDPGILPGAAQPLRIAASMKTLNGQPLVFMAGIDRSEIESDTRQFATFTWTALLILGIGLIIAVFLQVQIGLRPLFDLRVEIANVRKGKAARIEKSYPTEIQPLAEQVNRLLDHNQEVVERQRTHVGNLAHALKTPLSVMLAEAGTDTGPLADIVRRQSEVMKGQVDHHLRRARAAARAAHGLGEKTPVGEVIDELAVMLERVFQSKDVEIDWRAPDELAFLGERQDLQEILGNLMENACKWSKRRVRVSAGASGLGHMIAVVEDDGPGLPAEQRDGAMKRGARMDENAPGSGLGLAIVDDLTRAYGGRLTLAASDLGGLKAVLELPAAEA
ncbi:sensor histidine kinase [Brevundimonas sp. NIBR11]|uniref:sensor histidine kinase n=1 Tax=Brevundimonas sp. NIBR11 TaxID=3015999 RepID=UPI0022F0E623|nr:sensor histidine kinase [Brevundimonas sp. NIBR11]WGM32133.1 Adaptive-response sensory-kinase SasA [Brevundimonas sp. NIBR11]